MLKKKTEECLYKYTLRNIETNYIQYPIINHNGKEYEKRYIYMNHFAVHQKLT